MKFLFTILITVFYVINIESQYSAFLEEKNGFKNIKLGENVENYSFLEKCQNNKPHTIDINGEMWNFGGGYNFYHVIDLESNNEFNQIGNIKVLGIFIRTIDNLIFEILVITEYNFHFYKQLYDIFGEPSFIAGGENRDALTTWESESNTLYIGCNISVKKNPNIYQLRYHNIELLNKFNIRSKEQQKNEKIKNLEYLKKQF